MLASLLQRLKVPVIGCALVAGYLWTGAAAKLWIAERTPGQPIFGDNSLRMRPMRGHARASANMPFSRSLGVYAMFASGPFLGPTTSDFLKGIGIGIDPESPDYDARCRAALEQVAAKGGYNPWREHARLELAHLLARPASVSSRSFSWGDEPWADPAWITLGLVDSDRWWMIHESSGDDPARATELCAAILNGRPGEFALADTLRLKADLAAEYWDFAAQDSLLRDLVESCPASPLAQQALQELAMRLPMQGRTAGAAGLARRLLHRLSPAERVRLVPALAPLQAMGEGVPAARATLEAALREAETLARDIGGRRLANIDPRAPIRDALEQLPKGAGALPVVPSTPPGFPVRSRLLAAGKPLGGITVGLAPLSLLAQQLPPQLASAMATPRAAGTFVEPEGAAGRRRRGDENQAWPMDGIVAALRQNPALVARSDAEGNLVWPAVPAGTYGVILRAGTWQLPDGGRNLAVAPLAGPIVVSGPGTTVPDLQLNASLRVTPVAADERPPGVRWRPVTGAVSYRVSLLTHQLRWGPAAMPVRCIAAPALAPEVVWWREGVKGNSLRLTAEHFAGPLETGVRGGLHAGASYRWSVEARDASGKVIATAETLAPAPTVKLPTWRALRSATADPKTPVRLRDSSRYVNAFFRNDRTQFSSPFLDSLLQDDEAPVTVAARPALYPTAVSRGQGLPPRAALAVLSPAGGRSGMSGPARMVMMPGPMPPGARPPFPGQMPPGSGGLPLGFAGAAPMLPPPPGATLRPGAPSTPIAGVAPRPSGGQVTGTVRVSLETFDAGSRDRWDATGELAPSSSGSGISINGPLVLTPRDAPLPLPAGPGRLTVRLSDAQAEVTAVLLDTRGQSNRVKLRSEAASQVFYATVAPGEWRLQSLEIRPAAGEGLLESLAMEVPSTAGLYARAWREAGAAWIELTNLGPAPQPVIVGEGTATSTVDLASRGKARLPLAASEVPFVVLQHSGKKLELPIRGINGAPPP